MLAIRPTEHYTGVNISGDYWDLENLVEAIAKLIGEEEKYLDYQGSWDRLEQFCLTIRNAMKMKHGVEYVPNGVNNHLLKEKNMIAPETNVYFTFDILLPELLFCTLALNDFIHLYQSEIDASNWSLPIAAVRQFQSLVADFLKDEVEETFYMQFMTMIQSTSPIYFRYASQYVDVLNLEYIHLDKETRKAAISTFTARLLQEDASYSNFKKQLLTVTSTSQHAIHEIPLAIEYPKNIEW